MTSISILITSIWIIIICVIKTLSFLWDYPSWRTLNPKRSIRDNLLSLKKFDFFLGSRKYFSIINLYTLYNSQTGPFLKNCCYIWRKLILQLIDSIPRRVIQLINNLDPPSKIPTLVHRHNWRLLSLLYDMFMDYVRANLFI